MTRKKISILLLILAFAFAIMLLFSEGNSAGVDFSANSPVSTEGYIPGESDDDSAEEELFAIDNNTDEDAPSIAEPELPMPLVPELFDIESATGKVSGTNWDFNGTILGVNSGANIKITGVVTCGRRIVVDGEARITLSYVSITGLSGGQAPLFLNQGSDLLIELLGINTFEAGDGKGRHSGTWRHSSQDLRHRKLIRHRRRQWCGYWRKHF